MEVRTEEMENDVYGALTAGWNIPRLGTSPA